jgi:hypothetical protein
LVEHAVAPAALQVGEVLEVVRWLRRVAHQEGESCCLRIGGGRRLELEATGSQHPGLCEHAGAPGCAHQRAALHATGVLVLLDHGHQWQQPTRHAWSMI